MSDLAAAATSPVRIIAAKDIRDALRDRFIVIVTLFLALAALTALVTGAIALRTDVATFEAAKATLLALGKSADQIRSPEFYPLRLMRGAIEQTEIIGAAIAILIGYRVAASERGRQTLTLIMTQPIRRCQFVAGKAAAGIGLLAAGLAVVLAALAVTLHFVSGIGLGAGDLLRIAIVWVAAVGYMASFFLVSFILSLHIVRHQRLWDRLRGFRNGGFLAHLNRQGMKMRKKSEPQTSTAERVVKDIRRKTRKQHSAEEKIRIVLEGLRGEESIAALCRREGIATSLYYSWSKEFLEAGKKRLAGDTARQATSPEVKDLRAEAAALKEAVADLTLENRLLKKSMLGDGGDDI